MLIVKLQTNSVEEKYNIYLSLCCYLVIVNLKYFVRCIDQFYRAFRTGQITWSSAHDKFQYTATPL